MAFAINPFPGCASRPFALLSNAFGVMVIAHHWVIPFRVRFTTLGMHCVRTNSRAFTKMDIGLTFVPPCPLRAVGSLLIRRVTLLAALGR